jgi:hypothetical protein
MRRFFSRGDDPLLSLSLWERGKHGREREKHY